MNQLIPIGDHVPALVRSGGERAQTRFWEFFVSNIRNAHPRRAYGRAIGEFLAWCERQGVASIIEVQPLYVGAYLILFNVGIVFGWLYSRWKRNRFGAVRNGGL